MYEKLSNTTEEILKNMEHSADTNWLIHENLELHRQLRITMAFLEEYYHSNGSAKGITAPTEQEWQGIFEMLRQLRPRKDKRSVDLISDVLPFAFMTQLAT